MSEEKPLEEPKEKPRRIAPSAKVALGFALATVAGAGASVVLILEGLIQPHRGSVFDTILYATFLSAALTLLFAVRVKNEIRDSPGDVRGRGRAAVSRTLAVVASLVALLFVNFPCFMEAQYRAKVSRIRMDMRTLGMAIEVYHSEQASYPASATGDESVNGARFADPQLRRLPSFRLTDDTGALKTLTTPVAYIEAYPVDPCSPAQGATFLYYTSKTSDAEGWILISAGVDRRYDIDPITVYDPSVKQPSPLLMSLTYDPTNGTVSRGDVWRVK